MRAVLMLLAIAACDSGPSEADLTDKYTCTSNWPEAEVGGQCVAACADFTKLTNGATCIPDVPPNDLTHGGGTGRCVPSGENQIGVVEIDGVRVCCFAQDDAIRCKDGEAPIVEPIDCREAIAATLEFCPISFRGAYLTRTEAEEVCGVWSRSDCTAEYEAMKQCWLDTDSRDSCECDSLVSAMDRCDTR